MDKLRSSARGHTRINTHILNHCIRNPRLTFNVRAAPLRRERESCDQVKKVGAVRSLLGAGGCKDVCVRSGTQLSVRHLLPTALCAPLSLSLPPCVCVCVWMVCVSSAAASSTWQADCNTAPPLRHRQQSSDGKTYGGGTPTHTGSLH